MSGPLCGCRTSVNTPNIIEWCPVHAAAPDLLEALASVPECNNTADGHHPTGPRDEARAWCFGCQEWCYPDPSMRCFGCMARIAITKAKGKA